MVLILNLISGIFSGLRVTTCFPLFTTRANSIQMELFYLLENLFLFIGVWLFSFRYFQMAKEIAKTIDLKLAFVNPLVMTNDLERRKTIYKVFELLNIFFMIIMCFFYSFSFVGDYQRHTGFTMLVICCATFLVQVPLQVLLAVLAIRKFYYVVMQQDSLSINSKPLKIQLGVLLFWMASTLYLVATLIVNYYGLCDYQSVKRITIADSCYFIPKLVLSLNISYFLYKSTKH